MADKSSFIIHHDQRDLIEILEDEEVGKLFRALFDYSIDGKNPDFSERALIVAFTSFSKTIDRDTRKYEATCEKRKQAAEKRWTMQMDANAYESMQMDANAYEINANGLKIDASAYNSMQTDAKHADSDSESVSDSKRDSESLSDSKRDSDLQRRQKRIAHMFNMYTESLDKVKPDALTETESERMEVLINRGFTDEAFKKAFMKAEASDKLTRRKGNFRAKLSWILDTDNFRDIINGEYDN